MKKATMKLFKLPKNQKRRKCQWTLMTRIIPNLLEVNILNEFDAIHKLLILYS